MSKIKYYTRLNPPSPVITKNVDPVVRTYETKKTVKVIDKENDIYEITEELVCVQEVDTVKVTKSYAGQTGLESVMKRVAITGDTSLLGGVSYDGDGVVDVTKTPTTLGEVKALSEQVREYDKLPEELKKGRSLEEFIAQFNQAELDAYIKGVVDAQIAKAKEGGAE